MEGKEGERRRKWCKRGEKKEDEKNERFDQCSRKRKCL